jgi:hypothetical protein
MLLQQTMFWLLPTERMMSARLIGKNQKIKIKEALG